MSEAILLILASIVGVNCHMYTHSNSSDCDDDTCLSMDGPCWIPREEGILTRLDGVKVGFSSVCRYIYVTVLIQWFVISWSR